MAPTTAAPAEGVNRRRRPSGIALLLRRDGIGLGILWIALGSVVAELGIHARDYVDSDAGRYQRLAISIARTHSLVPRVNGVDIHSFSQLYPILIAPFFAHGLIVDDMKHVNIAGAYIMSSACIPAFLLTRRLTRVRWAPYLVAALTICMPWIVTSMFMMTEIAAYPASVWALYAIVVALDAPSWKHDVLVSVAVAVAFLARGELIGYAIALALALAAYELGRSSGGVRSRVAGAGGSILKRHPVVLTEYVVIGLVALTLYLQRRLSSVLGVYSVYQDSAHLDWVGLPRALVEHLATFSLAFAVVPFVVALAWIGANILRPPSDPAAHAFACAGACTAVVVFVQATNFDLVVNAYIHDRFLMYLVPVVLIGAVMAVLDERRPRWSLVVPLVLVAAGFAAGEIPFATWGQFPWLDLDTPISTVYRVLTEHLGGLTPVRIVLILFAVAGTGLFALGARSVRPRFVTAATLGLLSAGLALTSWAVFARTFNDPDRNGRQVSGQLAGQFDWVDRQLGPSSSVTAIMAPVSSDWFVNEKRWIDLVYFNKSIQRLGRLAEADPFDYVGFWFPKLALRFDPRTGVARESPTRWVLGSDKETRFWLAGPEIGASQDGVLVDAGPRWRLAWRTFGAYDDGWTRPGEPVRVRVYSRAGQRKPEIRGLSFVLRAPDGVVRRPAVVTVDGKTTPLVVTPDGLTQTVNVCVPAQGYADVRLDVTGASPIPGDLATLDEFNSPRRGGIFIASLGEADEIGPSC